MKVIFIDFLKLKEAENLVIKDFDRAKKKQIN